MQYRRFHPGKTLIGQPLLVMVFLIASSFNPYISPPPKDNTQGNCVVSKRFYGYSFLEPGIINLNAAYAPFFTRWDDYYERYYFDLGAEIQKDENLNEWIERFCGQPLKADVEKVVYQSDMSDIAALHNAAADATKKTTLPSWLAGNSFAEMVSFQGCTEVTGYLMFAKKCEPYVTAKTNAWDSKHRYSDDMIALIDEGLGRFKDTDSHFIKLRYAYQMIRLAHYARDWAYTVDLYNYLLPKVDRKKKSIIDYWTLGHLAGALQKQGKYPEAAYFYSLIFRDCASKRTQAFRSFIIRNDDDWEKTLALCQTNAQKSTLYVLRASGARTFLIEDMTKVNDLDPSNPQLDLMLISEVQELEKIFLRTKITDLQKGPAIGSLKREVAAQHLLDLQKFVRKVVRAKKTPNLKLWRGIEGYLELLAGDHYAAEKRWDRLEDDLSSRKTYDKELLKQIEIWRCLLEIMKLDLGSDNADNLAFRIRSYAAFKQNKFFEPFLEQWLAAGYAEKNHPGKAILAGGFKPEDIALSPRMDVYDDLLALANTNHPILLEKTMQIDTNPDRVKARLLEYKGAFLLSQGKPEAAVAVLQKITPTELAKLPKFSPFREKFGEKVHRLVTDTVLLNRLEIAQKILDLEFKAKAADALNDTDVAAKFWYRIGIAYYNMSYFGYEWEVIDSYRSGYNQLRLAQGPVFPLAGSPEGNRENTDVSLALSYFEKALYLSPDPEFAARAAFMAARCKQKQWFCSSDCTYRPGSKLIPVLPEGYNQHYELLNSKLKKTAFFDAIVKECKWFEAYAR